MEKRKYTIGFKERSEWLALPILLLVFVSHAISPNGTSSDSRWSAAQFVSLIHHHDLDLNEYSALLAAERYYGIECVDEKFTVTLADPSRGCPASAVHLYSRYPIGPTLIVFPLFTAMAGIVDMVGRPMAERLRGHASNVVVSFFNGDFVRSSGLVEIILASFLMGIAAAFVFLTSLLFLSTRASAFLALIFAFATPAWSTGSRALWQHSTEMTLIAIALCFIIRETVVWSAIPLALAYFARPSASILIAVLAVYIFAFRRNRFWLWAGAGVITALPFFAVNYSLYGRLLQPYFTSQVILPLRVQSVGPFLSALAGQCVSPSRGVLVFTPIFLFSLYGVLLCFRNRWLWPLPAFLAAALALHWCAISAFADWPGGYCYGPRYFSEMTPVFLFFLIPVMRQAAEKRPLRRYYVLFALASVVSFAIHMRGAVNWSVEQWNDDGASPAHAWDWHDPQFLRGLH